MTTPLRLRLHSAHTLYVGEEEMKILHLIAFILFSACSTVLNAHSDRTLQLEGKKMIGLPPAFGTAEFSWEDKMMRVGENQINLWAFENVIPYGQEYEISISSSWYHDASSLPPYVVIHLDPKETKFKYTILLSLEDLELIDVSLQYFIRESPNQSRFISHKLKVSDRDLERIKAATTKTPTSRVTQ